MKSRKATTDHRVAVVASNPETLDGILDYLQRAGVQPMGSRRLEGLLRATPAPTAAVLFPDDFETPDLTRAVAELRRLHPAARLLLITREPQRFKQLAAPDGDWAPLVLPNPSFGWAIVDAIRLVDGAQRRWG
jgi:hypothetical protein